MPRKRKGDGAEAPAGSRANRPRAGQHAAAHHADQAAPEIVTAALRLVGPHERDEVMRAAPQAGDTAAAAVDVHGEEGGAGSGRRVAAAGDAARPAKRARTAGRGGSHRSHRNDAQPVDAALEAQLDAMEAMQQQAAWHTSSSDDDDASGGDEHAARCAPFVTGAEARKAFRKKRVQSSQAETKKLDELAQVEAAENGRLLPRTLRELAALQAAAETSLQQQAAVAAAASASDMPALHSRRIAMPPLSVGDELMCKEEVLVRTAEYNELAQRTFTTRHGIKRKPQGKTEICCRSTAFSIVVACGSGRKCQHKIQVCVCACCVCLCPECPACVCARARLCVCVCVCVFLGQH